MRPESLHSRFPQVQLLKQSTSFAGIGSTLGGDDTKQQPPQAQRWFLSCGRKGQASNPRIWIAGLRYVLTIKCRGRQLGIQLLQSVQKKEFQDLKGSYNVPVLGNVQYSVSRIWVNKLQVDNSTIGFSEGTGVNLVIQNGQIGLSGRWRLAGLLGWFYNLAASVFKRSLQSEVNKHVCSEFKKGSAYLEKFLSTMNVSVWIDSTTALDCSIVKPPVISADSCKVDLKGELFRAGQLRTSPLVPAPFLPPDQPGSMLLLGVSESVATSAAMVYYTAGALQANFTDKAIPKNFPFRLNTESMGLLLPELKQRFPDMPMEVRIAARKQPVLSFHPGGLDVAVFAAVEAFVVLPNASLASVLLLHIDGNLTGQLLLEPGNLRNSLGRAGASLFLQDFHLSQHHSSIGEIQTPFLEKVLKVVAQLTLTRVNRRLKKGIALPNVYNASLVHPKVTMFQVPPLAAPPQGLGESGVVVL
ncbi:hypothetical protein lerEdw1_004668, partial [Lerista edwardsae]